MSADTWFDANSRYLAASLKWLRLRLEKLAQPDNGATAPAPPVVLATARPRFGIAGALGLTSPGKSAATISIQPSASASKGPTDDALARAAAEREEVASSPEPGDPPPALILLAQCLGLSAFERDTLLLCAASELDPGMAALFATAQGAGAARAFPTFSLALQALSEPTWDALSPHRPLRYARLIEISQSGATPLTASALRVDERIVNYLKGLNEMDERLAALLTLVPETPASALAPSQQAVAQDVLTHCQANADHGGPSTVQLLGADHGSKQALAQQVSGALHRHLYRMAFDALPTAKPEVENLARLWQREALLLPVALYLDAQDLDASHADQSAALQHFVAHDMGLVFVAVREAPSRKLAVSLSAEVGKPSRMEQRDAWLSAMQSVGSQEDVALSAQSLAGQFNLNLQDLHEAADWVCAKAEPASIQRRAWDACRQLTLPKLDALAQRLEPKATWEDLVLSDESMGLLRQIVGQVRERYQVYEDWGYAQKMTRGLGINALFAGESGTGKTMAAEVIANDLNLALYRIDLSAVVSKYIGETEKNLRQLFDAAEQGGAILLFDEADALFGKRSEVKDSHDRYANIEINYLLQRMESFSGLAILATNMKHALDVAFMRRLRFIVNFQFPGPSERRRIWQKAWPPEVPRDGLDYDRLARFGLSGGNIHSIALNAAFAAAQKRGPVTLPLLLSATRAELRKLDKPVNEAEFR
jgi:hypothetical protein